MPVFFFYPLLFKSRNITLLYPPILYTQSSKAIINPKGIGRAAQLVVVQGYVTVLCQKSLLSILNVAVSFLVGLHFQFFFKKELFPTSNFFGQKKEITPYGYIYKTWTSGGCVGGGEGVRDRSTASWSEQHRSSREHYLWPIILYPASIHEH